MPYASEKQRRYLHAKEPQVAAKWDREAKRRKTAKKATKKRRKR
jgi:hypothetical protein